MRARIQDVSVLIIVISKFIIIDFFSCDLWVNFIFNFLFSFSFKIDICKLMMMDTKKYGITVNILAMKIMPALVPALANVNLNIDEVSKYLFVHSLFDKMFFCRWWWQRKNKNLYWKLIVFLFVSFVTFQFNDLVSLLNEMLTYVAKTQRNKLVLEKNNNVTVTTIKIPEM